MSKKRKSDYDFETSITVVDDEKESKNKESIRRIHLTDDKTNVDIIIDSNNIANYFKYIDYTFSNIISSISNEIDFTDLSKSIINSNDILNRILITGFLSILSYNYIPIPYKIKYSSVDDRVYLGEPMYCFFDDGVLYILISKLILHSYLKSNANTFDISFNHDITSYENIILTRYHSQLSPNKKKILDPINLKFLYKIFVVIDHFAVHYINEHVNKLQPDWIDHSSILNDNLNFECILFYFKLISVKRNNWIGPQPTSEFTVNSLFW